MPSFTLRSLTLPLRTDSLASLVLHPSLFTVAQSTVNGATAQEPPITFKDIPWYVDTYYMYFHTPYIHTSARVCRQSAAFKSAFFCKMAPICRKASRTPESTGVFAIVATDQYRGTAVPSPLLAPSLPPAPGQSR